MPSTYAPISTTTLSTSQSSVTLNSFSGYTDLVIVINGTCSLIDRSIRVQYNGDTNTNYSYVNMFGYSGGVLSQKASTVNHTRWAAASSTNTPNTYVVNLFNYSNTTTFKTHLARSGGLGDQDSVEAFNGMWRSTSAITSILIFPNTGTFNSGMTFTVYGILKA
jgi:hypothetical protein